jgi:DNA-binding response OmpR family regulator
VSIVCPTCGEGLAPSAGAWTRCGSCRSLVFEPESGPEVIVAHESEPLALRITGVLSHEGFRPLHAPRGDAALRMLDTQRPRAAVLDVGLSDVMSFQLIERIRASAEFAKIPVILVASVFNRTAYKRRPTSLYGADDYVEQHHVHDLLPEKLRRLMQLPASSQSGAGAVEQVLAQDTRPELCGAERLRALAHSIVADIALYNQEEIDRASRGESSERLRPMLEEGRLLLADMARGQAQASFDYIGQAFEALVADVRGARR